jgi:toxin FitB
VVKYLLDTSVVSELPRPKANRVVVQFADRLNLPETFLSAITVGELRRGTFLLPRSRRRSTLEAWIAGLVERFADNILPVTMETCEIWAEVSATAQQRGRTISMADGLVAATAIQHGMHVVTRNVKDFEPTGVLIVNPWESE